jgi:hypothetical protein
MRWPIYPMLVLSAVAGAAEPAAAPAKRAPAALPAAAAPAAIPEKASPAPPKRLDLRVGDVRNYMTPEEFRALITGREEDRNTIVVQAEVPLLPMKSELDVPGGIIAPFWALAHPTQAWRLFLPDARVDIRNIPPLETKVPPPFAAGVPTF